MPAVPSIATVIAAHAAQRPDAPAFTFLSDEHTRTTLSFSQLDARARAIATALRNQGLEGEPVLVVCPPGLDYVCSLAGAWYAGAIAVPAYPPMASGVTRMAERIRAIALDSGAKAALVTSTVDVSAVDVPEHLMVDRIAPFGSAQVRLDEDAAQKPCLYQYTSGSTGSPKGVVVSHANMMKYQASAQQATGFSSNDVFVCWLPPYHDMGLIGGIVTPMFVGCHSVLMAPDAFIRRPRRWLQAIGDYRASVGMVPNFALELCVDRVPEAKREGLDLSSMRALFCGAEPIRADTVDRFEQAFMPHGLSKSAVTPSYGLAETTLLVSCGDTSAAAVLRSFDARALEAGRARAASTSGDTSIRIVGCGQPSPGTNMQIVNPQTSRPVGEGRVGEIWIASEAVAQGYLHRSEDTRECFEAQLDDNSGPFMRTGDLGFVHEGELFITGRLKDLIIIRGKNHYPTDIEQTAQSVDPALIAGCGTAFSVDSDGGEQLVIVQELDHRLNRDPDALVPRIAQAVSEQHQLIVKDVVLVKKGSLSKTSSGKLQRLATRGAYLEDKLVVASRSNRVALPAQAPVREAPAVAVLASTARNDASTRDLARLVRERVASACSVAPETIELDVPLTRYGIDSLTATELADVLSRELGRELPSTLVYDFPTVAQLARALSGDATEPEPARRSERGAATSSTEPIAIVGMACRLPGATDLRGFWRLLRNGVDAITEVPAERWDNAHMHDADPAAPGKISSRFGGFIEDVDAFDHEFFGVAQREAERMDPQQRLFLELAWTALEDAGISPTGLVGSDTGVFAAASTRDYALLVRNALHLVDADYGTGNATAVIANRVSYALGLTGPSVTYDTACSSSLVALQAACHSLERGESSLCLVGGVNAILSPEPSIYFSKLRALSSDGRCKAFDAAADGWVRGEGCGVVVLKRLSEAVADGDRVYALVAGSAVNHSGASNGLLAPHGPAQERVIEAALRNAGIDASELDYVEAHGVGTPLADTVEARALGAVLRRSGRKAACRVGSVKTNIGHLEAASGIASVIKAALALSHEEIPANLHFNDVHPDIERARLPLEFPTAPSAWPRREERRYAGVSAFGFGGCNAHVVLSDAPPRRMRPRLEALGSSPKPHLFTLSAKHVDRLLPLARRHLAQLGSADLADLCFTANVGRAHFTQRFAVVVRTRADLEAALNELLTSPPTTRVSSARPRVAMLFSERETTLAHESADADVGPEADVLHFAALRAHYARFAACGVEATLCWGTGVGEYAAACAAGALDWDDAAKLVRMRAEVLCSLVPGALVLRSIHEFRQALARVRFAPLARTFVSGMLERRFEAGDRVDADHFRVHLYETANGRDGRELLNAAPVEVRIDIDGQPKQAAILAALAECYRGGAELAFGSLYAPNTFSKVALPAYPFQRKRCWLPRADEITRETVSEVVPRAPSSHPLLRSARAVGAGHSGVVRTVPEDEVG